MRTSGLITFAFDDGYLDTYKHAIHYLNKKKVASTLAIPYNFIGRRFEKRPIIEKSDFLHLIKCGHEIASHTLSHPNLLRMSYNNINLARKEIMESKTYLEKLLKHKISSFVFPYIKNSQSRPLRLEAKKIYQSVRVTFDKPCFNKIPLKDKSLLKGFAITKDHTLSSLKRNVDIAEKKGLWLIEVFHLVGKKNTKSAHRQSPYRYFMHIDKFKKHVDYILSKEIPIMTQASSVKLS